MFVIELLGFTFERFLRLLILSDFFVEKSVMLLEGVSWAKIVVADNNKNKSKVNFFIGSEEIKRLRVYSS